MEMPKPVDAHKTLQRIAGDWIGEEKSHPSPWDPNGGMAIGRVHNRVALDGFVVVQDCEHERNGRLVFRGHGIFTWNEAEQCYILFWFDSLGFPPNVFIGHFENDVLTMTSKDSQGHSQVAFEFTQNERYTYRMEGSQNGSQRSLFAEATYDRKYQ